MAGTGRRNSEPAVSSIVQASVLDSARTNTNEHVDVLFLSVVRPNDVKKPLIAMYQQKKQWSKITEEIHFSLRITDNYVPEGHNTSDPNSHRLSPNFVIQTTKSYQALPPHSRPILHPGKRPINPPVTVSTSTVNQPDATRKGINSQQPALSLSAPRQQSYPRHYFGTAAVGLP